MNKIFYLIIIAFIIASCHQKELKIEAKVDNDQQKKLIGEIIQAAISLDSLDSTVPVAEELLPFIYFPGYKDTQGNEMPPPRSFKGYYTNEVFMAENLEYISQFNLSQQDIDHLKTQILQSKQMHIPREYLAVAEVFSIEEAKAGNGRKTEKSYIFYVPLFFQDSSKVYLQYDRNCHGCGYGSSIILSRQNDSWIKIGNIPTWEQ